MTIRNNDYKYHFGISIANTNIDIESSHTDVFVFCKDYLSTFAEPDIAITVDQTEISDYFANSSLYVSHDHSYDDGIATEYIGIESIIIYKKIAEELLYRNILLLHGAAVAQGESCFIFIAPSGTGKTTHAMNWLNEIPNTFIVNGDKPMVDAVNRLVYGTPWSGKEGMNRNISVPLKGLVYLQRDDLNSIERISFKEMLPNLIKQVYIPPKREYTIMAYHLIGLLSDIPCYALHCNMDSSSALVAYHGMHDSIDNI